MYSALKYHFGVVLWLFVLKFNLFFLDVNAIPTYDDSFNQELSNVKYILRWPDIEKSPFRWMGEGFNAFVKNKCEYKNCYVTDDSDYLNGKSNKNFDAVVFNGRELKKIHWYNTGHFDNRSPNQKYIFALMESPVRNPVCDRSLNGFFNWTWTYKLDSDFRFGYFTIYDLNGAVVGPKTEMHWIKEMEPIKDELKSKLSRKTKAAAWFVSNCRSKSEREEFARDVNKELQKYGWSVDIFGDCGAYSCPRSEWRRCDKMIKDDYYFYFSFENSFSEDYVTEKLTKALINNAVPVVYGGANYSRFLPEGSYLDGRKLGAKNLAKTMDEIIRDKPRYYDFFRWRNHYVYKDTASNADICSLCAMLNDHEKVHQTSVKHDLISWWNSDDLNENCY